MFDERPLIVEGNLSDKDLINAIIAKLKFSQSIKFRSDTRAAAQMLKRSKFDVRKFVERANAIIRHPKSKVTAWRGQEGVVRFIEFLDGTGKVEVIEKFGRMYLNLFIEYDNR